MSGWSRETPCSSTEIIFYDGNTQVAYLRENVRMENGQVTLFTDSLNYERIPNIGYYFEGGLIVDSLNQLSSLRTIFSGDEAGGVQ